MKKIISLISIVLFLTLLLIISYSKLGFSIPAVDVFATKTDQSSTSTDKPSDQSSTDTSNSEIGSDVVSLLARVINAEARGEPYLGQVAVGAVIMNRVKNAEFPNTVTGVIYQKGQFSSVTDGQFDKDFEKNTTVHKAAQEAYNGYDPTNGAIYFYNAKTAKSSWLYTRPTTKVIGNHTFAK